MVWYCQNREGVNKGHPLHLTTEDAFITAGVAPDLDGVGDDLSVVDAGGGTITIKKGKAYLKYGDGISDVKLYLVRNASDENIAITGTGWKSVIVYADRNTAPNDYGDNWAGPMVVDGVSDRPLYDSEITALLGPEKPWIRLADLHWDGTTMRIIDRRTFISGAHLLGQNRQAPIVNKNLWMNSKVDRGLWGLTANNLGQLDPYGDGRLGVRSPVTFQYSMIFVTPKDPYVLPGRFVASLFAKRTSGTGGLRWRFKWFNSNTSAWNYGAWKYIWVDGEATTSDGVGRYAVLHFTIPDDPGFDHGEIEFETIGTANFELSRMKLERGVLPTKWIPRPIQYRTVYFTVYPWVTDASAMAFPHTVDLKSYGAHKTSFAANVMAHYHDVDSWSWFVVNGVDRFKNWVWNISLEAQNGHPAVKNTSFVNINDNQELQLNLDTANQSGSRIGLIVLGYLEYA